MTPEIRRDHHNAEGMGVVLYHPGDFRKRMRLFSIVIICNNGQCMQNSFKLSKNNENFWWHVSAQMGCEQSFYDFHSVCLRTFELVIKKQNLTALMINFKYPYSPEKFFKILALNLSSKTVNHLRMAKDPFKTERYGTLTRAR